MHAKTRWRLEFGSRFIEGVSREVLVIGDRTAASQPLSTNKNALVFQQELIDKQQEKTQYRPAPLQYKDGLCRARVVVKC